MPITPTTASIAYTLNDATPAEFLAYTFTDSPGGRFFSFIKFPFAVGSRNSLQISSTCRLTSGKGENWCFVSDESNRLARIFSTNDSLLQLNADTNLILDNITLEYLASASSLSLDIELLEPGNVYIYIVNWSGISLSGLLDGSVPDDDPFGFCFKGVEGSKIVIFLDDTYPLAWPSLIVGLAENQASFTYIRQVRAADANVTHTLTLNGTNVVRQNLSIDFDYGSADPGTTPIALDTTDVNGFGVIAYPNSNRPVLLLKPATVIGGSGNFSFAPGVTGTLLDAPSGQIVVAGASGGDSKEDIAAAVSSTLSASFVEIPRQVHATLSGEILNVAGFNVVQGSTIVVSNKEVGEELAMLASFLTATLQDQGTALAMIGEPVAIANPSVTAIATAVSTTLGDLDVDASAIAGAVSTTLASSFTAVQNHITTTSTSIIDIIKEEVVGEDINGNFVNLRAVIANIDVNTNNRASELTTAIGMVPAAVTSALTSNFNDLGTMITNTSLTLGMSISAIQTPVDAISGSLTDIDAMFTATAVALTEGILTPVTFTTQ